MGRARNTNKATSASAHQRARDIADDPFVDVMGAGRGPRQSNDNLVVTPDDVALDRIKDADGNERLEAVFHRNQTIFYVEDGNRSRRWTVRGDMAFAVDPKHNHDVEGRVMAAAKAAGLDVDASDTEMMKTTFRTATLAEAKQLVDLIADGSLGYIGNS